VLALAASAEVGSEHPVAKAVVSAAKSWGTDLEEVEGFISAPGKGVRCHSGAVSAHGAGGAVVLVVGTRGWLQENGVQLPPGLDLAMGALEAQGKTVSVVGAGGVAIGAVAMADRSRPEARAAVQDLRRLGVDVWMATGDNRATAESVAASVGIPKDHIMSAVSPSGKAQKVCPVAL
ncbi:unnamed protein product, partial [Discosporangium mesarthrocarpum]